MINKKIESDTAVRILTSTLKVIASTLIVVTNRARRPNTAISSLSMALMTRDDTPRSPPVPSRNAKNREEALDTS